MPRASLVVALLAAAGCSLATSLDGYTGGAATASTDAGTAALDGGALVEAGADASDDAGPDPFASGLLAWWRFDEPSGLTAVDSSGNGNDGTLQNGVGRTAGKTGGALDFDGVDDQVFVPERASIATTTTMSVTFWLKIPVVATSPRIISHVDSWDVKLNDSQPQLSSGKYAISSIRLGTNAWHHVGIVFESGVTTIYVDGAATSLSTNTYVGGETLSSTTRGILLGTLDGTEGFLTGQLDEVRLYGRALSAQEMAQLAR